LKQSVEKLKTILYEELDIYRKLLGFAHEKRKMLLEKFSTDLQTVVGQEELLVQRLIDLEVDRREEVCRIAGNSDANLDSAVEKISEADGKSDLWLVGTQLRDVVNSIRQANDENQKLLEQALELTQYSIKLITRVPGEVTYGPAGKQAGKRTGPALIDRKA
jgi:flagellar biosynthesis/type III secretory pathway chaperone